MVVTVRDGKKVWPTCKECGCRLSIAVMDEWSWLSHFGTDREKDARGCSCSLLNKAKWVETRLVEHIVGV